MGGLARLWPLRPTEVRAGWWSAVSNFGVLAIMEALPPKAPGRHLRLLVVLETVTPDRDGWRRIGVDLLAEQMKVSQDTAKLARNELIDAKLLEYEPGRGAGHFTRWRFLFPADNGGGQSPPFTGDEKGGDPARKRGESRPKKGGSRNAVTSGNANHALKDSALKDSALGSAADAAPSPGRDLALVEPGITPDMVVDAYKIGTEEAGLPAPPPVSLRKVRQSAERLLGDHNVDPVYLLAVARQLGAKPFDDLDKEYRVTRSGYRPRKSQEERLAETLASFLDYSPPPPNPGCPGCGEISADGRRHKGNCETAKAEARSRREEAHR